LRGDGGKIMCMDVRQGTRRDSLAEFLGNRSPVDGWVRFEQDEDEHVTLGSVVPDDSVTGWLAGWHDEILES
jgi:hypothetical protein